VGYDQSPKQKYLCITSAIFTFWAVRGGLCGNEERRECNTQQHHQGNTPPHLSFSRVTAPNPINPRSISFELMTTRQASALKSLPVNLPAGKQDTKAEVADRAAKLELWKRNKFALECELS
jgi:hypothetical protein